MERARTEETLTGSLTCVAYVPPGGFDPVLLAELVPLGVSVVTVTSPVGVTTAILEARADDPSQAVGVLVCLGEDSPGSVEPDAPVAGYGSIVISDALARAAGAGHDMVDELVHACETARSLGAGVDGFFVHDPSGAAGRLPALAALPANVDVAVGRWSPREFAGRLHRAWCARRLTAELLIDLIPLHADYRDALERYRTGHRRQSLTIDPTFMDLAHKERLIRELLLGAGVPHRPEVTDGRPPDSADQRIVRLVAESPGGSPSHALGLLTHRGAVDSPFVTVVLDVDHAYCVPSPRKVLRWRGGTRADREPSLFTAHGDLLEKETGNQYAETVASLTGAGVAGRVTAVWWSPRNALLAIRFVERLLEVKEFQANDEVLAVVCTKPASLVSGQRRYLDRLAEAGVVVAAAPRRAHLSRVSHSCAWHQGRLVAAVTREMDRVGARR